jgi:hypothetical protein
MKTAENLKKVALIFFIVLGLAHIISGLMFNNNYFIPTSMVVNRVLDIPFAMTALIYGLASFYTSLSEKKHKFTGIAMSIISLLIFLILIYINFLLPDKTILPA